MEWRFRISMCQKVSKAHMISTLITSHVACRNHVMKLSDLGALSDGKEMITFHTSSSVKWLPKFDRLR
jgi:hypothetical protein